MPGSLRSLSLYAACFVVIALASGVAAYVYKHEPPRDQLEVEFESTPAPDSAVISGSITAVEGARITLSTADGTRDLALPAGAPVEDLAPAEGMLPAGTQVNVGVEDTEFGQVLTGIVAIEDGG